MFYHGTHLIQIQNISSRMLPMDKLTSQVFLSLNEQVPTNSIGKLFRISGLQGKGEETNCAKPDQSTPAGRRDKVQGDWPTFTNSTSRKNLIIRYWISSRKDTNRWLGHSISYSCETVNPWLFFFLLLIFLNAKPST